MNDEIQATLRDLVRRQGAAVYTDPRRCEAMLRDLAGEHHREIFVLVTAVRAGAVDELLNASTGFEDVVAARAATRLGEEFGLDADAARWAVASWADALGIRSASGPPPAAAAATGPLPAAPPAAAPVPGAVLTAPPPTTDEELTRTVGPAVPVVPPAVPVVPPVVPPVGAPPAGPPSGPPPVEAPMGPAGGPPPVEAPMGPPGVPSPVEAPPAWPPAGPPAGPPATAYGWEQPPPVAPGPAPRRRHRRWIPLVALFVIAALITSIVIVLNNRTSASAGEIFLEAFTSPGAQPAFTPSMDTTVRGAMPNLPLTLPTSPTTIGGTTALRGVAGDQPGLYGGTRDNATCDVPKLLDFLNTNADKARAWAQTLGIPVSGIAGYLSGLTPILLRADTRVTNHGFRGGRANPVQSVLQAGTAVLVDRFGIPRTRCACGNPLKEPVAVRQQPKYTGSAWAGFSPSNVVVVSPPATVINNFTLVDVSNGNTYVVPSGTAGLPGTTPTTAPSTTGVPTTLPPTTLTVPPNLQLGSGDIQVTLLWTSSDDLDVHVVEPSGAEISYSNPASDSGGQIDHDDIPSCGDPSTTHVEHIFWSSGTAPTGAYKAFVEFFGPCGQSADFELRIEVNKQVVYDTQGTVTLESPRSTPVAFQR